MKESLVSAQWVHEHFDHIGLVDASWFMPTSGVNAKEEWQKERIPGAIFFDFDNTIKDKNSSLPHMLPTPSVFEQEVGHLGISEKDTVIVYDATGLFSAPRVWWMFKAMGHKQVAVLNGGLPAWKALGYPVISGEKENPQPQHYHSDFQSSWVKSAEQVNACLQSSEYLVIDARPKDRFLGLVEEPREGVRSGHMPNAKNLPFPSLIQNGFLLSKDKLKPKFDELLHSQSQIIFSCGSGVTAAILALAASELGIKNLSVYDGSWTEWGANKIYPVVK